MNTNGRIEGGGASVISPDRRPGGDIARFNYNDKGRGTDHHAG